MSGTGIFRVITRVIPVQYPMKHKMNLISVRGISDTAIGVLNTLVYAVPILVQYEKTLPHVQARSITLFAQTPLLDEKKKRTVT